VIRNLKRINYDLTLVQNLDFEYLDLGNEFFKYEKVNIISRANGTHCIVHAKK